MAQEEALEALLFVAQQDEEWVVRYAAVVGLESLAIAIDPQQRVWRSLIDRQFNLMSCNDHNLAVRGRVWYAQQKLQHHDDDLATSAPVQLQVVSPALATHIADRPISGEVNPISDRPSPLPPTSANISDRDWEVILSDLYEIKRKERANALKEGDPRLFQDLAANVDPQA